MYRAIRKIHLYSAFVVLAFLLMYFITGAVIIMEDIFPRKNTTKIHTASTTGYSSHELAIEEICRKYSIRGKIIKKGNRYYFDRPGHRAVIHFTLSDSAEITIHKGSFGRLMSDFHRLRGYAGHWTNIVWALLYDLSCLALLVFAFTGLYLWWVLERKKTVGFLLLLLSTGLTVFTLAYLFLVC